MQKSLHINADKCTGCLQCEMACSYENYEHLNPAKSRIKVFDFHHSRQEGSLYVHAMRRGLVPARVPRRSDQGRCGHRRQDRAGRRVRGLQGVHDRLPVRHDQLRAG